MTDLQLKNELIVALNENICEFDAMIDRIDKIYDIKIPIFPKVYLDKIYEFDEYFNSKGMTFFQDNLLGSVIIKYYDDLLSQSINLLSTTLNSWVEANGNPVLSKAVLLLNKKCFRRYKKIYIEAKNFSIEKDIKLLLVRTFKSLKYYQYSPNEIYLIYNVLKKILIDFGLYSDKLDKTVFPLVKKNEQKLAFLYESVIEEIGTNDEIEIRNYIDNFVLEARETFNDKQKCI